MNYLSASEIVKVTPLPPVAGEEAGDYDCPHCGMPLRHGKEIVVVADASRRYCLGFACQECRCPLDIDGMTRLEEAAWENYNDDSLRDEDWEY